MRDVTHVGALLALSLVLGCSRPAPRTATSPTAATTSDELVPFASEESIRRFERSRHKVDFFSVANQFEGQENFGMCGPATAVIILNTLRAGAPDETKPVDRSTFPEELVPHLPPHIRPFFHRYTQRAFFDDERISAVKTKARFYGGAEPGQKRDPGMQLRQLHEIFRAVGLDSTMRIVDDHLDDARARDEIVGNLARAGDYVVVNYARNALGQEGGGHISPLGAYDEASDSFLVLDVNPNQGKSWVWVPARRLFAAMRTLDMVENRGYLLVGEAAKAPR